MQQTGHEQPPLAASVRLCSSIIKIHTIQNANAIVQTISRPHQSTLATCYTALLLYGALLVSHDVRSKLNTYKSTGD